MAQKPSGSTYTNRSSFAKLFGSPSRAKMLDVFLTRYNAEMTAPEVAELANVDPTTVRRNIDAFVDAGIIKLTREIRGSPLYQLNTQSHLSKVLGKAHEELLRSAEQIDVEAESKMTRSPVQTTNKNKSSDHNQTIVATPAGQGKSERLAHMTAYYSQDTATEEGAETGTGDGEFDSIRIVSDDEQDKRLTA